MGLKPGYLNWWQSLILAFACTLAGVIGAVMASTGGTALPGGEISTWATDLLKLIPHAMMLFGLMADAITYNGVYWTSTIVGLSAMPLHNPLESILSGLFSIVERFTTSKPEENKPQELKLNISMGPQTGQGRRMFGGGFSGCSILGGDIEKEHKTSESLVVTAAIVAYFFLDLWLNRGMINALGILVVGIVLMGGQAVSISDCFTKQDKSLTAGVLYALLFGVIIGGGWYSFFQAFYPMYLPTTVIPLANTITGFSVADTGFVYVPGVGLVSASSPQGQQAIANGTALSPDEMSEALETTGTVGTGLPGQASTCS
jgi:hypothetical protein